MIRRGYGEGYIYACTVAFIVAVSVLMFGSVEPWAFAVSASFAAAGFNFFAVRDRSGLIRMLGSIRLLSFAFAGFFFICLLQLIPLPLSLLKVLSPAKYALCAEIGAGGAGGISFYNYDSLNGTLRLAVYAMVFLLAVNAGKDRAGAARTIKMVVLFGFLLALFAIIQESAWNGKIYWFRGLSQGRFPFGPFVNRNHFAGFMGMVIPLGLGLALDIRRTEETFLYLFFSIIMALSLFYSLSRGGVISFSISTVFFLFLSIMRKMSAKSKRTLYIGLFVSLLLALLLYLGIWPILGRFAEMGVSDEGRLMAWKAAIRAIKDYPLMGTGIGTFRYVYPVYNPGMQMKFLYAHNDYLQLLVETGFAGALFAGLCLISVLAGIVRSYRKGNVSFLMAGLTSSLLYISVHSLFDFNLHIPSNAITLSAVLGLAVASATGSDGFK